MNELELYQHEWRHSVDWENETAEYYTHDETIHCKLKTHKTLFYIVYEITWNKILK